MTVVTPGRNVPIVLEEGVASQRFASFLDDTVSDLNELTDGVALNITEETGGTITITDEDAFTVRRKTSGTGGQRYAFPANSELNFEQGTWLEIFNDTPLDLDITSEDDLESTESGTIEGPRTIAAGGWGRMLLIDTDDPTWKLTGDQIT